MTATMTIEKLLSLTEEKFNGAYVARATLISWNVANEDATVKLDFTVNGVYVPEQTITMYVQAVTGPFGYGAATAAHPHTKRQPAPFYCAVTTS